MKCIVVSSLLIIAILHLRTCATEAPSSQTIDSTAEKNDLESTVTSESVAKTSQLKLAEKEDEPIGPLAIRGTLEIEIQDGMLPSSMLHPFNQVAVLINGHRVSNTRLHSKYPLTGLKQVNFDERLRIPLVPSDAEITFVAYQNALVNVHAVELGRATLYLGDLIYDNLFGQILKIKMNENGDMYIRIVARYRPDSHPFRR